MINRRLLSATLSALAVAIILQLASCSATKEIADNKPAATATPAVVETTSKMVKIVRLDPSFDKIVPADAKVETLASGYNWVEGPVWNRKDNYLIFSDLRLAERNG